MSAALGPHPESMRGPAPGARAWVLTSIALALPALALGWVDAAHADLLHQHLIATNTPAAYAARPWTAWTTAWVHLNPLHLAANLLGVVLVALLGLATRVDARSAGAWLLAWPLTFLALLPWPQIRYCVGLSGVLHAGVAVCAVTLIARRDAGPRWTGWGLMAGLLLKVLHEHAWNTFVSHHPLLGMDVVPAVHLSGVVCATLLALAFRMMHETGAATGKEPRPPGSCGLS